MSLEEANIKLKSKLSPAKLALLKKRLSGEFESNSPSKLIQEKLPTIVPQKEEKYQPFPLTDVQQAYWIGRNGAFELSNISTHVYFEIETINLNLERFEEVWQQLIERHDMLRAIIRPDGQQQILQDVPVYKIKTTDLRGKNTEVIARKIKQLREKLSHQVLAAGQWPLFEIQAVRLDNNKIRLCISLDVLIGDAWSFDLILGESLELMKNPDLCLPPLELSFRDYVLAEVDLHSSQIYQRSRDYWLNRIPTFPSSPELPLKKNLSAVKSPHFDHRTKKIDPNIWHLLKTKATEASLTPSTLLLAAFAEVLTLWSKSGKFGINLTLYNRLPLHPQINQIAGDFTSLTLLEINNSQNESFLTRAGRIQKQLWNDYDHRYFSGVQVLRELARSQKNASGVIMPVIFTSTIINENLNRDPASEKLSSLHRLGEVVFNISQTPQVYLDIQVHEIGGSLIVDLDSIDELFPEGMLDDFFATYCNFLERLACEKELWQTKTRQLLPSAQIDQIKTINNTSAPVPEAALLHSLFFEQVNKHPQNLAVATTQRNLTYQELSLLAQQLGHKLRQLGAHPNQLIAIVMEKGWEQIVAVLGILASGAAYIPIHPDLPRERQLHLLQQAQVKFVLTQSKIDSSLELPNNITRLCVDTIESSTLASPLSWTQKPDDLAYVIYTSGSTGLPKGVMIDHRGAVNTILDINQRFHVNSKDRVFALSSLSFDLSVYDIFGTLAAGGTIVIPNSASTKDPAHWLSLIEQHQITVWNSVPALMQMLVEYAASCHKKLPQSLRLALLSGDWLPLSLPNQIRSLFQDVNLISLGGATEASIWSILYPIEQVDPSWKSIPYGRAMANQRFYVLNEALEDCPIWVTGQLYIGGIGLAKGYWQNEEKTNSSFIIHPLTQERLYKTGDLGRYLSDGNIEFLGREDFQVKVNGFRIELGEIETIIKQDSTVKEAVVTAFGELREQKKLVAYIVPNSTNISNLSSEIQIEQWREFIRKKLPEYMIPSEFIVLKELPITSNGKLDRRALPVPKSIVTTKQTVYVKPETNCEKSVAEVWQEILKIEEVGINDNFFEIGGNSLLLVRTQVKLKEIFGQEISLVEMMKSPTISSLAKYINQDSNKQEAAQKGHGRAKSRSSLQAMRNSRRKLNKDTAK
ncbi:amino acid adenylation domain-containing protein [Calothrix parasitica NIES-267]|uniref:Amino acid adenylation domain-containing protein n=1 Tax=Calothrix parasitica NIES-267 TaxID=1973488 RepID=A0A1Z4LT55_9CYAN|nr:amino acid adenylation domain-containing protein [Calothrix parasitica NIES-267]